MTSYSVRSSAVRVSLVLFTTGILTASAGAAVILNLVISPATTAGGGATSTRSGANAFQIYAIDTAGFGIFGYNLTMGPIVTASNNRTPFGSIQDANSDISFVGFATSRSPSNAPQMQGYQGFSGAPVPYQIQGMGQTVGSFADVAAAGPNQPASVVGLPASGTWGGPYNNGLTAGPKKWLFIGEGLWDTSVPITSPTQFISAAAFTVYSDQDFDTMPTNTILPCLLNCRAPTVVDAEFYNVEADDPGNMTHVFTTSGSSPIVWDNLIFDSYSPLPGGSGTGPLNPAAFDTGIGKFSWNTIGSPAGTYRWHVTANNPFGTDQGSITIHIAAVPEPTTLTLVAVALLGSQLGIRCRPLPLRGRMRNRFGGRRVC